MYVCIYIYICTYVSDIAWDLSWNARQRNQQLRRIGTCTKRKSRKILPGRHVWVTVFAHEKARNEAANLSSNSIHSYLAPNGHKVIRSHE